MFVDKNGRNMLTKVVRGRGLVSVGNFKYAFVTDFISSLLVVRLDCF